MNEIPLKFRSMNPYLWMLVSLSIPMSALMLGSQYWAAIALCFTFLIYLMYRRYLDDVTPSNERSGNTNTHEVDNYVNKLEHKVGELEKSATELHESNEKFRREAYHDQLTGLPNRKFIVEALSELLKQSDGEGKRFAILYLNLNRFRMINESLGHGTGDRIIRQVGKRLCESIGEGDIAGHLGGDEFTVVLSDVEDPTRAIRVAEEIAKRVGESVRFQNREVYTSASIGIVFASTDYKRAEDILRDADIAMYNAKDHKKRWVIFDRTMFSRAVERQQFETDLRYAIVCNELELFYQPIVRLNNATLFGFEALVRWNHPKRGLISPSEFIPVAEATGLIAPMSIQILRNACLQLAAWENEFTDLGSLMMSVNFSVANITDVNIVDEISSVINTTGITPSSLKIEITESAVMGEAENAIELLDRIKSTGISLSIDDFGTGYSNLSYLHKFPIDYLKIDRSFVSAMDNGGENEEIVRTIVALAKALRLAVIAEGIESKEQFQKLREFGCEYGQGYFFSRPLPVGSISPLLAEGGEWAGQLADVDPVADFDADLPIQLESTH